MFGLNVWVFMALMAVLATGIVGLSFFIGRRNSKSAKPIERNQSGTFNGNKIGDKTYRVNREAAEPQTIATSATIPVESWSKKGVINAEIVNPADRTIGFYHVDLLPGKDYGRSWLIESKNIFSLRIGSNGTLEKMPHNTTMAHPTSEVYEAIQTKEDVIEVFGNHDEGDNKLKIGLLVLAACVALFLMFMAVYKGRG